MRLLPREGQFFVLFVNVANRNKQAANELRQLFEAPPERRRIHVDALKRLEHDSDQDTHEVANRIDQTFITPLDREDIHHLASALDDVMDAMDGTARRAEIFRVGVPPAGVLQLVGLIELAVEKLAKGVEQLKKGDVLPFCWEVKKIEEEGDAAYQQSLGRLFDEERDPVEIIRWKEIYDALEFTLDQTDDVANVLESITLKNA